MAGVHQHSQSPDAGIVLVVSQYTPYSTHRGRPRASYSSCPLYTSWTGSSPWGSPPRLPSP